MQFNWTQQSMVGAKALMPTLSIDGIGQRIAKGGITIPADWRASGGWQKKEFLIFWCDARPWVAIIDLATRDCLAVIPAWMEGEGGGHGVGLYERINGARQIVCTTRRHQIRRAIRLLNDGTRIPSHFRNQNYVISVRAILDTGRIKVLRLGKEPLGEDPATSLAEPAYLEACRAKLFAEIPRESVRHAVLNVKDGNEVIEVELVEKVCSGGW